MWDDIPVSSFRVSPPVLPIQFGTRHEQMPVLRQGTFIQFESSQRMNGIFVALLLREVTVRKTHFHQFIASSPLPSVKNGDQQFRKRRPMSKIRILKENRSQKKSPPAFNSKLKHALLIVVNSKRTLLPPVANRNVKVRSHQDPIDGPSRAPLWHEIWLVPHQPIRMQHLRPQPNLPSPLNPKSWRSPSASHQLGVLPAQRRRWTIRRRRRTGPYPIKNKRLLLFLCLRDAFPIWFFLSHRAIGLIELYTIFSVLVNFLSSYILTWNIRAYTENRFFYSFLRLWYINLCTDAIEW